MNFKDIRKLEAGKTLLCSSTDLNEGDGSITWKEDEIENWWAKPYEKKKVLMYKYAYFEDNCWRETSLFYRDDNDFRNNVVFEEFKRLDYTATEMEEEWKHII